MCTFFLLGIPVGVFNGVGCFATGPTAHLLIPQSGRFSRPYPSCVNFFAVGGGDLFAAEFWMEVWEILAFFYVRQILFQFLYIVFCSLPNHIKPITA